MAGGAKDADGAPEGVHGPIQPLQRMRAPTADRPEASLHPARRESTEGTLPHRGWEG